jgi:hypothetical protein
MTSAARQPGGPRQQQRGTTLGLAQAETHERHERRTLTVELKAVMRWGALPASRTSTQTVRPSSRGLKSE